jgi:uncharacterized protein
MFIWMLATFVAYFVKGICGFASTMVFTSIASLGHAANVLITPTDLLLGTPTNIIMIVKHRQLLRIKLILPLFLTVMLGSIPGVFFLRNIDAQLAKAFFGVLIILLSVYSLLGDRIAPQHHLKNSKPVLYIIGILSGIVTGLYGVGALLAAYFSHIEKDPRVFKGNICAVFLAEDIFRLIMYIATGIITADVLKSALLLMPFMIIGMIAGLKCSSKLNDKRLNLIINLFLILSSIILTFSVL